MTDHWRKFIRPLMWRCKWIELQIKEFQSQALKYDRELAEHEQRKQFDFETYMVEGFHAKSLPFSSCIRRNKVMKRKKRKRFEETTDTASYMLRHNLFSYYGTKLPNLASYVVCVLTKTNVLPEKKELSLFFFFFCFCFDQKIKSLPLMVLLWMMIAVIWVRRKNFVLNKNFVLTIIFG